MSAAKYSDCVFREGRGRFVAGVGWVSNPDAISPNPSPRDWTDPQREALKQKRRSKAAAPTRTRWLWLERWIRRWMWNH